MILPLAALLLQTKIQEIRPGLGSRTPVLTFHDVVERRGKGSVWFDCTVSEFRQILDALDRKGAIYVSLDQLYDHLVRGKALSPRSVAITFADSYRGFYEHAMPILRKRRIPVAMFVHTGFVGSPVGRPKMDWGQLGELDRGGLVTIASQTVSHPADLRRLSYSIQLREMTDSKADLERHLGHPIRYLAYPNGKFDSKSQRAARAAGYLMAFSEEQRMAESAPSILAVPRYVHTKWREATLGLSRR